MERVIEAEVVEEAMVPLRAPVALVGDPDSGTVNASPELSIQRCDLVAKANVIGSFQRYLFPVILNTVSHLLRTLGLPVYSVSGTTLMLCASQVGLKRVLVASQRRTGWLTREAVHDSVELGTVPDKPRGKAARLPRRSEGS